MKIEVKTILCATDFSDCSRDVIPYGIFLAKEFPAKLILCHMIDLTPTAMHGHGIVDQAEFERALTDYAAKQFNAAIEDRDVDWDLIIRATGHVADEIGAVSQETGADLVITATHGRSGLKRLLLGSVTERLMQTLHCPLLVVRSPDYTVPARDTGGIRLNRILVGCDFSLYSNLALQHALNLAQQFQAEIHLVHVISPPVYREMAKPSAERSETEYQDLRSRLSKNLSALIPDEAKHWCTFHTALLAGHPHEELTKYAVVNAIDLIAVGVRGHGLVESLFVGSTTDRVMRQTPCAVLSVRSKDAA